MAYYSKLRPTVYHEYKNCNVGNNMVKGNLKTGKPPIVIDGHPLALCATCAALGAAGTGIPGVPKLPRPFKGAIVETYYSKERPEIFHMCQNCFLGQNIEKENLVANEPPPKNKKAKLCKICVKLCIKGKCITGAPIPADKIKLPYYSKAHTPPKVFHACQDCYIGQRIQPPKRAEGEPDEARLCKVCYRMLKEDRCT